ncbi:hypothetical protein HanXRQr2_Chr11g0509651 [Helianthus annuus]|uniref:Uncharacterized protein n=1 Tax=Helianthus annuus TaxID=4232 RepID=A0A9K3HST5_HELAN|nr:hypothetical protein HanXRQr2_Chr11g0509651 [Helianthus annuus]
MSYQTLPLACSNVFSPKFVFWFLVVFCRMNRRIVSSLFMFKTGVCSFYGRVMPNFC